MKPSVEIAFTKAKAYERKGDVASAAQMYQSILSRFPKNLRAQKALAQLPVNNPVSQRASVAYINQETNRLAQAYQQKQYHKVIEQGQKLLSSATNSAELYNLMGAAYNRLEQFPMAVQSYRQAIKIDPKFLDAYNNLGNCLKLHHNLAEAETAYRQALKISPTHADANYNLGILLSEQDNDDAAVTYYLRAIAAQPDHVQAHSNLGVIYKNQGNIDAALGHYSEALRIAPNRPMNLYNLANLLLDTGRLDEAISTMKRVTDLAPNFSDAHYNLANAYLQKSDFPASIASFGRAIDINPTYANAHFNQSTALFGNDDLKGAWLAYEWRWKTDDFKGLYPQDPSNEWSPGTKRNTLVWAEQGIGDEILFASMLPEFNDLCESLTVSVDERLIPLFRRSFDSNIAYTARHASSQERDIGVFGAHDFDAHIPMGSLARYLRNHPDDFKAASAGYLQADPQKVAQLREQLHEGKPSTVIGISWKSNNKITGAARSLELKTLIKPLMRDGVRFVNLQYGDVDHDIDRVRASLGADIVNLKEIDNFTDIDTLAALICACDTVVSAANATVHLAGALNQTVHALLPYTSYWRWQTKRSDSYWYDSVKLYRQASNGEWADVLAKVASNLAPNNQLSYEAMVTSAKALVDQGQIHEAIKVYEQAVAQTPLRPEAYSDLGNAFMRLNGHSQAIEMFSRAIEIDPHSAIYHNNIALALMETAQSGSAIKHLQRAIKLSPHISDLFHNLGDALKTQGEFEDAEVNYRKAITLRPTAYQTRYNLANMLLSLDRHAEALVEFRHAIEIEPDLPEAYNNIGLILALNKATIPQAIQHYDKALQLKPGYDDAMVNKSYALLKTGDFKQAWPLHEHRKDNLDFQRLETRLVPWTRTLNNDKKPRVLALAEQGIGDEIMLAALIPELRALCSALTLTLDERLIPLFRRSFGDTIRYVERYASISDDAFDSHILIGSLPLFFRNEEADFLASSAGYLKADPQRTRELRAQLSQGSPEQIIGISWRSSSETTGELRSLELEAFLKPLIQTGRRFVNLQYGDSRKEVAEVTERLRLSLDIDIDILSIDMIDNLTDLDGLAALISACDKVVSTANATVHLAGALNKETHALLTTTADWRWQTERSHSPWYQSVHLHRQSQPGQWDDVLASIAMSLDTRSAL